MPGQASDIGDAIRLTLRGLLPRGLVWPMSVAGPGLGGDDCERSPAGLIVDCIFLTLSSAPRSTYDLGRTAENGSKTNDMANAVRGFVVIGDAGTVLLRGHV